MKGVRHESGRLLDRIAQLGFLTELTLIRYDAPRDLHRKYPKQAWLGPRRGSRGMSVQEMRAARDPLTICDSTKPDGVCLQPVRTQQPMDHVEP